MSSRELFEKYHFADLRTRIGPETFCKVLEFKNCIERKYGSWEVKKITHADLVSVWVWSRSLRWVFSRDAHQ